MTTISINNRIKTIRGIFFRNKLILILFINIFLFSLILIIAAPIYNTTDDVTMMHIVFGMRNGGEPSAYLINSNILIGFVLKYLFDHWNGVNWYSFYILLIHLSAMTTLLYVLLQKKPLLFGIIIYSIVFIFLELPLLLSLQFTTTAFVVFLSGYLLFASTIDRKRNGYLTSFIIAEILMIMAGLIRPEMFCMALLLTIPLFMVMNYRAKQDLRIPIYLGVLIVTFFIVLGYDHHFYYKDSNWKSYKEFNAVRVKLLDYPRLEYDDKVRSILKEIKWSKNDYDMLNSWFYYDKKTYSQKNLEYLVSNARKNRSWAEAMIVIEKRIDQNKLLLIFTILNIIAFLFCGSRKEFICVLITLVTSSLIVIYLGIAAKLPDRVFLPIMYFINSLLLFNYDYWDAIKQRVRLKKTKLIFGCIIILFSILIFKQILLIYDTDQKNRNAIKRFDAIMSEINPSSNQLYISWGASLRIQGFRPFISPTKYKQFNYLISGWTTNSPLNDRIFSKYHIADIYLSLIHNKNLYLICKENNKVLLKRFMKEHYNIEISYKTVNKFGRTEVLQVFQI